MFVWFYAWCFPFHRGRKALENRTNLDDDKIEMLEQMLKEATEAANDSERKYEEVCHNQKQDHCILLIPKYWFRCVSGLRVGCCSHPYMTRIFIEKPW